MFDNRIDETVDSVEDVVPTFSLREPEAPTLFNIA